MAKLIYSSIASLDGYVADEDGNFAWARPSEEVHSFINDLERSAGTHLYGRRMYETMAVWETDAELATGSEITAEYAQIWQGAEKVVYSSTLERVSTSRTRLQREVDTHPARRLQAGGGEGRLLQHPRKGLDQQDSARARVRSRHRATHERCGREGPDGGWSRPRRPSVHGRLGRRMPHVRRANHRRRRKAVTARRGT